MRTKRTLRAPFVATVTTAALSGVGCATGNPPGIQDAQPGPDAMDAAPQPDARDVTTTPDATDAGCPSTVPSTGSPCSSEGATCEYMPCPPYVESARCMGGQWFVAACNPPAPDAGAGD